MTIWTLKILDAKGKTKGTTDFAFQPTVGTVKQFTTRKVVDAKRINERCVEFYNSKGTCVAFSEMKSVDF